jgi:hypothetical protein
MIQGDRWPAMLRVDPRPWLLASDDPAARWVALTHLLDIDPANANALAAHRAVLGAPTTERLVKMLNGWTDRDAVTVRDARYRPNVLNLLADIGLSPDDDGRIASACDDFADHVADDGRFMAPKRGGGWDTDSCDHCAVTDTRMHLGFCTDGDAVDLIASEFTLTDDGRGWGHRTSDGSVSFCPDETTLALRVLSQVQPGRRPRRIRDAVRSLLQEALGQIGENPNFVILPWPAYGHSAFSVLDAVGRYGDVWDGPRARPIDRTRVVKLLVAFVEANFDDHGAVFVRHPSRGFATLPMARRNAPSPLATAVVCVALRRFEPLAGEIVAARPIPHRAFAVVG